jgi:protein ImuA
MSRHSSNELQQLFAKGQIWRAASVGTEEHFSLQAPHPRATSNAIPFNAPEIDTLLPAGGLQCGAIHELFYNDPLLATTGKRASTNLSFSSTIPALLASNAVARYYDSPASAWESHHTHRAPFPFLIVWIGKRCWPTPFTIPTHYLPSCLFIDPPNEKLTLWAIETALRSHAVRLVIADCPRISLITSRRLLLAAEAHHTTALLLRHWKDISTPSSATTRWQIAPAPSTTHLLPQWELTLHRLKGGAFATQSWLLGLEERRDEEREVVSLRVFPRMGDRGYKTEATQLQSYGT